MMKSAKSVHAPKKFTSTFKLLDVTADPYGTHGDGFQRNALAVRLTDLPIWTNIHSLFRQHAITGVKITYRPNITSYISQPTGWVAPQMLFAEDKNSFTALAPNQLQSQDNCRTLTASRGFSKYIARPRPHLFQANTAALAQGIKVIGKSREIMWLSPSLNADPEAALPHVFGQLCVEDVVGAVNPVQVGELWCKVYVICKEQSVANAL